MDQLRLHRAADAACEHLCDDGRIAGALTTCGSGLESLGTPALADLHAAVVHDAEGVHAAARVAGAAACIHHVVQAVVHQVVVMVIMWHHVMPTVGAMAVPFHQPHWLKRVWWGDIVKPARLQAASAFAGMAQELHGVGANGVRNRLAF